MLVQSFVAKAYESLSHKFSYAFSNLITCVPPNQSGTVYTATTRMMTCPICVIEMY